MHFLPSALGLEGTGRPTYWLPNIDANRGRGKSFFLDRFAQMLRKDGYTVAQVNAWQDDYADDPLLPVMHAIDEALGPLVASRRKAAAKWETVKKAGGAIAVAAVKGAAIATTRFIVGTAADRLLQDVVDAEVGW